MLLVGSTARNTGKTTFCLDFIERWGCEYNVVGLKVTTIREGEGVCHHGDDGCGACASFSGKFEVIEETDLKGKKDTNMLLAAGASRVFWIRTLKEYAAEAFEAVKAYIPTDSIITCESNVLSDLITPGVSVLMHKTGIDNIKPSAEAFKQKAGFVCDIYEPNAIAAVLDKIVVTSERGQISLKKKD